MALANDEAIESCVTAAYEEAAKIADRHDCSGFFAAREIRRLVKALRERAAKPQEKTEAPPFDWPEDHAAGTSQADCFWGFP